MPDGSSLPAKSSQVLKPAPRALRLALEPRMMFDAAAATTAAAVTKTATATATADTHDASAAAGSQALLDAAAKAAAATATDAAKSAAAPSADTGSTAGKTTGQTTGQTTGDQTSGAAALISTAAASNTTGTSTVHEVVIVDTSVADYQTLIAGMDPNVPVILLEQGQRTVHGIATALAGYHNLDTIILVTEGGDGGIILGGNHVLTDGDLASRANDLAAIGASMKSGGDFLLMGCSVAADATGKQFVDDFARYLGNNIDVAASTNRTGPAALGGDWVLEYSTGAAVDSILPFSVAGMQNIDHCLGCTDGGVTSTSGKMHRILHDGTEIGGYTANSGHPYAFFWDNGPGTGWSKNYYTTSLSAFLARTDIAKCQSGPTVTDAKISISGASGTSGAYKIGDTVTVTWDNTASGDNNSQSITGVTVDFSQFGGGSAVVATNSNGTWTASYTIVAGSIDQVSRNVSVTATSTLGSTTTSDTSNATVDNIAPTVTSAKVTLSGASGTGGAYKVGDTVTASWNNTASGDNNSDTTSGVTFDFSAFGGGSAVAATNSLGTWSATYTIVAGSIDATNRNVSVTVKDNAGNTTTATGTTNATVDNIPPTATSAKIAISGASGTGGAYKVGDTVTATWDNSASGDNNSDTISGVTFNFSQFGGGTAVAATNSGGIWTATYLIAAGSIDTTNRNVSVTVTDNAGNATTTAGTANATVDNTPPVVADSHISISGASGGTNVFLVGDTVTATWNNTASGDNNSDTLVSVTVDFSAFGGGAAVAATNSGGTWTASYQLPNTAAFGSNKNVSFTVTDNAGNVTTTADTSNASVANTAPVLDSSKSPALPNQSNDTTALPSVGSGSLVSTLIGTSGIANVSDPDNGALVGIAITSSDTSHGVWWYSTDGGANWTNLNATVTSNTNALLLAADANTRLYFQVTDTSYSGTMASALTFRAWDQTSGTAGTKVSTSTNGTTTAFSSATDTASLTLTLPGPSISDAYISISGGTGTGGAYKIGDTVTATWNNSASGDNNSDTVTAVTMDFSQFGGGSAVTATNSGGVWTASYTITAGSIDATNRNVSVTATNVKGTLTTADSTNATVDSIAPTLTDAKITVSGGASGVYKVGDTVTVTWNDTASGDNNSDTISSVSVDFSAFGGGAAVAATNSSGTWTATYVIASGVTLGVGKQVTVTATDNAGNTATVTESATLSVVNKAPTLSTTTVTPTFTEGGSAVSLFSGTAISVGEAGQNVHDLTLTVGGLANGSAEILTVDGTAVQLTNGTSVTTAANGYEISVSVVSGVATVTITKSGDFSASAAQTLINGLTYSNTSNNPTVGSGRTVTLTGIQDTGGIANGGSDTTALSAATTVTLSAVNNAPVASVPGAKSYSDTAAHAITGVSIADVDANSGTETVTLGAGHGNLAVTASGSATISGNGTGSVTISGTLTDVNATLATLTYASTATATGSDTITIGVNDGGNTGSGGAQTDSKTIAVTLTGNDTPVVNVAGAQTFGDINAHAIAGVSVTDTLNGATVTATVSDLYGHLRFTAAGAATVSGSGTGSVTITGSLTDVNATLASLAYTTNLTGEGTSNDTITVAVNDGGSALIGGAKSASQTIAVTVTVVTPPEISVPGAQAYTDTAVHAIGGVSVTDHLVGATVTVTVDAGHGKVAVSASGAAAISGNNTGTVTITGSLADVNATLTSLSYATTATASGSDTITLTARDSGARTVTQTIAVSLTGNDIPVLTLPGGKSLTPSGVQAIGGVSISDTLNGGTISVTVRDGLGGLLSASASGTATLSGNNSTALVISGSLADVNATLASLALAPTTTGSDVITITVNDNGTSRLGGAKIATGVINVTINAAVVPLPAPSTTPVAPPVAAPTVVSSNTGLVVTPTVAALSTGSTVTLTETVGSGLAGVRGTATAGLTGNAVISASVAPPIASSSDSVIVRSPSVSTSFASPVVPVVGNSGVVTVSAINSSGPPLSLARDIGTQSINAGQPLTFQLPQRTFISSDPQVTLDARQSNGQPLPSWLKFDAASGTFSGQPPAGVTGALAITVTARDSKGNIATATFKVNVGASNAPRTSERHGANDPVLLPTDPLPSQLADAQTMKDPAAVGHKTASAFAGKPSLTAQLHAAAGGGGTPAHHGILDDGLNLLASLLDALGGNDVQHLAQTTASAQPHASSLSTNTTIS